MIDRPRGVLRAALKGGAERALVWSGAARVQRRRMSGRVLVLAYHNVVPDDAAHVGDLANHLPLSSFAAQLAQLRRTHDVIPLSEAFTKPRVCSIRPRAVITFDDAYRGSVVHGLVELVRQQLPATFFVAPSFIGGGSFWWDALAQREGGLDPELRERALTTLRGEDATVRAWATRHGYLIARPTADACGCTEEELAHAASTPGITLGAHTWAHPNLVQLSPHERAAELARPLQWLRARFSNVLPWLAYPYGAFDRDVERAAATAGYEGALTVSGGFIPAEAMNRFAIPRINIPAGLSDFGFALCAAGLRPG